MQLSALTECDANGGRDPEITGLTSDSREVKQGFLFAALPGKKNDGRSYINAALEAGAAALLVPEDTDLEGVSGIPVIVDENPRRRFSIMAANFYPRQPVMIAAVTGTSGKTSTVQFARQLWEILGHRSASIGTLGIVSPRLEKYGSLTTPDPVSLHKDLNELAQEGVERLAMEASSHGIDQYRLDGVHVRVAGFTNLSRDHLDYHSNMVEYLTAKSQLFSRILPSNGVAVLNSDAPEYDFLAKIAKDRGQRIIDYGSNANELRIVDVAPMPHGQRLSLNIMGKPRDLELPLAGRFQVWNAMCALGLVIGSGDKPEAAAESMSSLQGVRGRIELVGHHPKNGAAVYVDYAHKPGALETVLEALRPHVDGGKGGKLVAVFGCGGNRDRGKRPMMGEIAQRLADRVIVTDDNPRDEDATFIRSEVMAGCPTAQEIGGRAEAIRAAIHELHEGDVVVIAGKGHEQGQIVGSEILPFDDALVARQVLEEIA